MQPELNRISKELAKNQRPKGYMALYEFLNNEKKVLIILRLNKRIIFEEKNFCEKGLEGKS
jgi:hypothetical protein